MAGLAAIMSLCVVERCGRDREGFGNACGLVMRNLRRELQMATDPSPGEEENRAGRRGEEGEDVLLLYTWCWKACAAMSWMDKSLCLLFLQNGLAEMALSHIQLSHDKNDYLLEGMVVLASVLRHPETVPLLSNTLPAIAKAVSDHLEEEHPKPATLVS